MIKEILILHVWQQCISHAAWLERKGVVGGHNWETIFIWPAKSTLKTPSFWVLA